MVIDIGAAAEDRVSGHGSGDTVIAMDNPANASGSITQVEIWASANLTGCKVGTFYGAGESYTCRDFATIGNVTSGSKQTFSGLSIDVESGDFIGTYYATGIIEAVLIGFSGVYTKVGDQTEAGTQTYSSAAGRAISLYGTGHVVHAGEVSIISTSSLAVLSRVLYQGASSIQSVASLSIPLTRILPSRVSIQSGANLIVVMEKWPVKEVVTAINAVSSLSIDGNFIASGKAGISVSATVITLAALIAAGEIDIDVVTSVIADCIERKYVSTVIQAVSSLLPSANYIATSGAVSIMAVSTLDIVGLAFVAKQLIYSGTLAPGDVLVIDTDTMTVKLNEVDVRVNFTGKFFKLYIGDNEIEYSDHEASRTALISVDHSDRWV